MKLYNPNKPQEKAHERPGSHNVSIGDSHLVNYLNRIIPFPIKNVNRMNFSSRREKEGGRECQGLSMVLCVPYQNAAILTQGGNLLIGKVSELDIQACVDFAKRGSDGGLES